MVGESLETHLAYIKTFLVLSLQTESSYKYTKCCKLSQWEWQSGRFGARVTDLGRPLVCPLWAAYDSAAWPSNRLKRVRLNEYYEGFIRICGCK